ncbi:MAG: hypothetical protein ACUVXJ_19760 [Phycisphaerae bacterium]
MQESIMVGCDLHDRAMLPFSNDVGGRAAMIEYLRVEAKVAGAAKVLFAYEASGQGFGLYDERTDAGFEGHVLAPTKMPPSAKQSWRWSGATGWRVTACPACGCPIFKPGMTENGSGPAWMPAVS